MTTTYVTRKLNGKWAIFPKDGAIAVMTGIESRSDALAWRDWYNANPQQD